MMEIDSGHPIQPKATKPGIIGQWLSGNLKILYKIALPVRYQSVEFDAFGARFGAVFGPVLPA
jgi:hypothetical protein